MPIQNITYNTIITEIKNWIKINCINISNYNSLPACFKPGYSTKTDIGGANSQYPASLYCKIITSVPRAAATDVDIDFNEFISSINLTNINTNCSANNYLAFMNNIVIFLSDHLIFTTSQFSANKYLIYRKNSSYAKRYLLNEEAELRLITAEDFKDIIDTVVNITKLNIRSLACTYSFSFGDDEFDTTPITYYHTGNLQTYTVPMGCANIAVMCAGASGMNGNHGYVGGNGGLITATISVTGGQTLYVWVGAVPTGEINVATYNASDIRTSNEAITSTTGLNSRLVVAGGGGNASITTIYPGTGGDGGGLTGESAKDGYGTSATGGTQSAGGNRGTVVSLYGYTNGNPGTFGLGGNGARYDTFYSDGRSGAGGAGWYGGGGGACCCGSNITWHTDGQGGAGGSSYANSTKCSNVAHTQGGNTGNGYVIIQPY